MRLPRRLPVACLLLLGLASASRAECPVGNELLEAHGRGSIALSRKYGIALHFAGLDGNVFGAAGPQGDAARVHLASNLPALSGAFPVSRPYTPDGLNYSVFLLDARLQDDICRGREITAICSLAFRKSEESRTGANGAKVACQFTVL